MNSETLTAAAPDAPQKTKIKLRVAAARAANATPFPPLSARTLTAAARAAFAPTKNRPRALHRNGKFRYA